VKQIAMARSKFRAQCLLGLVMFSEGVDKFGNSMTGPLESPIIMTGPLESPIMQSPLMQSPVMPMFPTLPMSPMFSNLPMINVNDEKFLSESPMFHHGFNPLMATRVQSIRGDFQPSRGVQPSRVQESDRFNAATGKFTGNSTGKKFR